MRGEIPQFRRCCCCIPLRRGLIGWAYVKLALDIMSIAYLVMAIRMMRASYHFRTTDIPIWTVICIFVLADISFNIIFIVAGHRKSAKLLKVTYIYNLICLVLVLLSHSYQIYRNISVLYSMRSYIKGLEVYYAIDTALRWGLAFSAIFVQVYLVLLVRSEMIKLQKQNLEMEFTNHLASGEPRCTLHNKSVTTDKVQCMGEETQYNCTVEKAQDCTVNCGTVHGTGEKTQYNCTVEKAQDCTVKCGTVHGTGEETQYNCTVEKAQDCTGKCGTVHCF